MEPSEALSVLIRQAEREEAKLIASSGYVTQGGAFRPMAGRHRDKQLDQLHRAIAECKKLLRSLK